jgi:predicted transcriptional regulator
MNWSRIISQLMDCGVPQVVIAAHLDVSQATVSQILRSEGTRKVDYEKAVKLLDLHRQCLQSRNSLSESEKTSGAVYD